MNYRTILLPTDLESASVRAMAHAFELAEALGATLNLLYVYKPVVVPDASGRGFIPYERLHREALAALEKFARPHRDSPALGRKQVVLGEPKIAIMEYAEKLAVDLIVLGTHGRTGFKRAWLGSVAEEILRIAPCPVLVVREAGPSAPRDSDG